MQTLLIDIGNSRLKWGVYSDTGILQQGDITHRNGLQDQDLHDAWQELSIDHVLCSSVAAPTITAQVDAWVRRRWNCYAQRLVSPGEGYGIRNAYITPSQLGSDRWAAMVAARHECDGFIAVVNCGTATTIDVVAPEGQHLGGIILPGVEMMSSLLVQYTAGIKPGMGEVKGKPYHGLLGKNTRECIDAGGRNAIAGMVLWLTQQLEVKNLGAVNWVITGGAATQVLELLPPNTKHRPNLVLDGLALMIAKLA